MACSDATASRHLPLPSPSPPLTPLSASHCPDSSACAVSVCDAPAGTVSSTAVPGDAPASSMPSMTTSAVSPPGLMTRSRLTWFSLLAGLKMATWCSATSSPPGRTTSVYGTRSCSAVSNPSSVRL